MPGTNVIVDFYERVWKNDKNIGQKSRLAKSEKK